MRCAFVVTCLVLTACATTVTIWSTRAALGETQPPQFDLPLDCLTGDDCFVQKYVDHEPGDAFRDYRCGSLSDNGHSGTDFRLRNFKMMERGVPVLAAAAGTVVKTRDGMPDVHAGLFSKEAVSDRGLGNAVVIDHGAGWRSIYGHLRRGGIAVTVGQRVAAGDRLGLIGLSGLTEFPHVHFQVNFKGSPVDPFTGIQRGKPDICEKSTGGTLWRKRAMDALAYRRTFLLNAGFSATPMQRTALQYGLYDRTRLSATARNLLFGAFFSGVHKGDVYRLRFVGPNGDVIFDKTGTFSKHSAVKFITGGKTNRTQPWPLGRYRAQFELKGHDASLLDINRYIDIR
jgi:hypothetical protein